MERLTFDICCTLSILDAFMSTSFASDNIAASDNEPLIRPTIGLVLSGGGARGAAHVGVIKVLDEL